MFLCQKQERTNPLSLQERGLSVSNMVSTKTGKHLGEASQAQALQGHLTVDHGLLVSPSPTSTAHEQSYPTVVASHTSDRGFSSVRGNSF